MTRDLHRLANAARRRWPHHAAAINAIAHPPDHPCPPACPKCHLRHQGPCPCPICHTNHRRDCPTTDRPRPGCLTCQLHDDTTRALELADTGDGLRSPNLLTSSGSRGPASPKYADDDERGGVNTPTEAAALRPHPDRGALARSTTHTDEAANWLNTALTAKGHDTRRLIDNARRELTDAITALHPILPHATAQDRDPARGDPGCLAHRKGGAGHEPSEPGRLGICRRCRGFRDQHGVVPPPEVIARWEAGYDVTPAMVNAALNRKGRKPTPKQPKAPKPPKRRARMLQRITAATARIAGNR